MNEAILKMYEREPKNWYMKIAIALLVAGLLAWSLSAVQSGNDTG